MKLTTLLPLAAAASAFVLPSQDVVANLYAQPSKALEHILSRLPSKSDVFDAADAVGDRVADLSDEMHRAFRDSRRIAHQSLDDALSSVATTAETTTRDISDAYFDAQSWTAAQVEDVLDSDPLASLGIDVHDGRPPRGDRPPKKGRKGHHGHKSDKTIYELIAESKYTTKLAKLISDYPDLVDALNSTEARYTVFAPTDHAFEKIPHHGDHKPSRELIEKVLLYHISPKFYPAGRVLATRTIPTLLNTTALASEPVSQRMSTQVGFSGLTVNYYSRVVAVNIFGSNGVIHGIDSLLLPPPPALKIVDLVPAEFSTLELGLFKTGLFDVINKTDHTGGTLFAPSNFAFQRLGPRANAFLFSPPGLKYLRALLKYHIVPDQTLYSDYYIDGRSSSHGRSGEDTHPCQGRHHGPPRGYKHFDLETALDGQNLAVDISRYGRLIDIRLNGFTHVIKSDAIAKDGVIHEVGSVLIPPHKHSSDGDDAASAGSTDDIDVTDLKQRLEPFVDDAEFAVFDTDMPLDL